MTEGVQREFRDQISRPRIEEAESSWSRRETTSLGQPGPRTFTIATPTVSLTAASERMPSPTTTVQPHWTAPTKLTPKGKELENKSVKDQRPDFKENDMRDHLSGCNDEDGDHLKLDFERLDEEDQGPNKETEQTDVPNQVSRINNNQVTGVEPQHGHDDCHSQVYGRHSQILGVEPQVPTTRMSDNQVTGVEPQVSTSRELDNQVTGVETQHPAYGKPHKQANGDEHDVHNQVSRRDSNQGTGLETQNHDCHSQVYGRHSQVLGVELQTPTSRGHHYQVTGREVQGSGSEETRVQPPCCLAHSYKTNIVFTERLLLRNSSKDQDKSDKDLRKQVKVLEFMNWWRAVFELSALTTAFHVYMGPGFHNDSTKSLKSPQTSLEQTVQHQAGEEVKKDICEEPRRTDRVTYCQILLILLVVLLVVPMRRETTSDVDRVHQFTDGLGVTTMKPRTAYRRSGENLEFLNDCLATQIEAIIQELERGGRSDPKFWSFINHQKRPQNETIIEKLETRECGGPRSPIPLRNERELEKDGRNNPKFLDPIKNKKGSKNETIDVELEGGGRDYQRFWILKRNKEELQNQTSLELEGGGRSDQRFLDHQRTSEGAPKSN